MFDTEFEYWAGLRIHLHEWMHDEDKTLREELVSAKKAACDSQSRAEAELKRTNTVIRMQETQISEAEAKAQQVVALLRRSGMNGT